MVSARAAYAEIRSLVRRSASHSSSLGGNPNRDGANVAPGSIKIPRPATSTYVAIDRTPSESAPSGMTFMVSDAPASIDLDTRSRDHRGVVGGEEDDGGGDVLGLVQAAERDRVDVAGEGLRVDFLVV